jgi:hypothetical protein
VRLGIPPKALKRSQNKAKKLRKIELNANGEELAMGFPKINADAPRLRIPPSDFHRWLRKRPDLM